MAERSCLDCRWAVWVGENVGSCTYRVLIDLPRAYRVMVICTWKPETDCPTWEAQ